MKRRPLYGAEPRPSKDQRRLARQDIRRGVEPAKRYWTGKMWRD